MMLEQWNFDWLELFFPIVQRQGRLGPSGPVQNHRSNVATYTGGNGARGPQGPVRNFGPRPPAPPPSQEGPLPPAPPLDVTGESCETLCIFFRLSEFLRHQIISVHNTKTDIMTFGIVDCRLFCVCFFAVHTILCTFLKKSIQWVKSNKRRNSSSSSSYWKSRGDRWLSIIR